MVKFEFYAVEQTYLDRSPRGLRFFGRDENKNKIDITIEGDRPYFYILASEASKIDFLCTQTPGFVSLYGEPLIKIGVENPWDIHTLRKKFVKTYEADVSYPTRFLIDNNIFSMVNIEQDEDQRSIKVEPVELSNVTPRIMIVDIETEYYGGSNKDMMRPIICIGFYDNYTNRLYSLSLRPDGQTGQKEYRVATPELKTDFDVTEIWCKDEKELLELFVRYVVSFDIDIFTGWNVKFDMLYICHRLDVLGIKKESLSPMRRVSNVWKSYSVAEAKAGFGDSNPSVEKAETILIKGRSIIDLMSGYKRIKWKQIASFRLDTIAQVEFKSGKVEYRGWMAEFWKRDFERFIRYNLRDIEICYAIDKKYSIVDSLLGIRRMSGCDLSDILFNSKIIDTYILRYCKGQFVLPSKLMKSKQERENDKKNKPHIEGGFVLEPKVGILRNVCVLDLKSLYPSIMLSFNMSPETVDSNGEIVVGNGVRFKKKTGILKQILVDILAKRDELRAMLKRPEINQDPDKYINIYKRQYYYKTFQNSFYGVTLYSGFRLFNPAIGSSITYVGRELAHKIKALAEQMGYDVIRQDTDSAFVDVHAINMDDAILRGKELEAKINASFCEWFKENGNDITYFSIKFEKLYGIMFSGAEKKLYAGKIVWDWEKGDISAKPDIEIKGFATVKSDRSAFSKKLQKNIFEMLFAEASPQDIQTYIYEEVDKFFSNKYSFDDIGIPKAITRDLDGYKVKNPWVKGVEFSMNHIKGFTFQPKPLLLYCVPTPKYPTENFCFNNETEIPPDLKINMPVMAEKSIYNVVKHLLPVIGLKEDDVWDYIVQKTKNQTVLSTWMR